MVSEIHNHLRDNHCVRVTGSQMSLTVKVFDGDRSGQYIGQITRFIGGKFTASPALRQCRAFDTEREAYEFIARCWDATNDRFKNSVTVETRKAA